MGKPTYLDQAVYLKKLTQTLQADMTAERLDDEPNEDWALLDGVIRTIVATFDVLIAEVTEYNEVHHY